MSIPAASVDVPDRVRDLAGDAGLEPVWANDIGGLTFRASPAAGHPFYIKWGPRNDEWNLRDEAERMRWAGRWIRVP